MRILLINPKSSAHIDRWIPLGLGYVATALVEAGEDIRIYDRVIDDRDLPEVLTAVNPDAIGLSVRSDQVIDAKILIKAIRKKKRKIPIAIGGPHATIMPDDVLTWGKRLTVVVGEPEKKPLAIFKKTGVVKFGRIGNLDSLPFVARDLFDREKYRDQAFANRKAERILATRGCIYDCSFCCNKRLSGGNMRKRSAQNVVDEIEVLYYKDEVRAFVFAASVFTFNRRWALDICNELMERELNIFWKATTRADCVDKPLLDIMLRAGCRALGFGVESGDPKVLEMTGKGITIPEVKGAFTIAHQAGVPTFAMFIEGLPGETPESLKRSKDLSRSLHPPLGATFQYASPLPGSRFYETARDYGRVVNRDDPDYRGFGEVGFIAKGLDNEGRAR